MDAIYTVLVLAAGLFLSRCIEHLRVYLEQKHKDNILGANLIELAASRWRNRASRQKLERLD